MEQFCKNISICVISIAT